MEFKNYKTERSHLRIDPLHLDKDIFLARGERERDGKWITLGSFDTLEEAEQWLEAEKRGEHETIRAYISGDGQFFTERDGHFVSITD